MAELQLLRYPVGGHYRRHLDVANRETRAVRRELSFLLYLTPEDWDAARDGGTLQIYPPGSGAGDTASRSGQPDGKAPTLHGASDCLLEVEPSAGTLVIFESVSVPHAVMPTRRERLALVGWFCSQ